MRKGVDNWQAQKDDYQNQQKRTFTRWINTILQKRNLSMECEELEEKISDGVTFPTLVEILSGVKLAPKAGSKTNHKIQRIQYIHQTLVTIEKEGIKLVNVGAEDFINKNTGLILGTIWALISKYQVFGGGDAFGSQKELLDWVNMVQSMKQVTNFTSDFSDGAVFIGILKTLCEAEHVVFDLDIGADLSTLLREVFDFAKTTFEIPTLLDPVDVIQCPDQKSIIVYVSYFQQLGIDITCIGGPDLAPYECTAEGGDLETPTVGQENVFSVILRDEEGDQMKKCYGELYAVVAPIFTSSEPMVVDVEHTEEGAFICRYTIDAPGEYLMSISIDGEEIGNSPLSITAT